MDPRVTQALSQLEEIDGIISQDSHVRMEGDELASRRFMSLVHQKEGLIDLIRQAIGMIPRWTAEGYVLTDPSEYEEEK